MLRRLATFVLLVTSAVIASATVLLIANMIMHGGIYGRSAVTIGEFSVAIFLMSLAAATALVVAGYYWLKIRREFLPNWFQRTAFCVCGAHVLNSSAYLFAGFSDFIIFGLANLVFAATLFLLISVEP